MLKGVVYALSAALVVALRARLFIVMYHVVLAESALETVPNSITSHPAVTLHAQKLGRDASQILLDKSWHYSAMKNMHDAHRRGRPDLVHFSILSATSTPLYQDALMKLYIHTVQDVVIWFADNIRIPKSYHRFEGLFSKLLCHNSIEFEDRTLLEARKCTIHELIKSINPTRTVGLSVHGKQPINNNIVNNFGENPCVVVGGFQRGEFTEETIDMLDCLYNVSPVPLETHVVISRILYDMERL